MAALTPVTLKRTSHGNDLAGVAAAGGGDTFANTGKEFVVIKNGSGAGITLTIPTPGTVDGDLTIGDRTATIGAGETRAIGPFPPSIYSETVSLGYSSATSVTVSIQAFP